MARPSMKTDFTKTQLQEMAESVEYWWHSIDLGQGIVTKGFKTPETLQHELESLRLPDLRNKTVLDIGAWDGFFSFEAERRGAKRIVAVDHYVWSLHLTKDSRHWRESKPGDANWPDKLPGKRGYDTAHEALASKVETVVGDFMTMDLEPLGTLMSCFFSGCCTTWRTPSPH